ncbi:MAG: alkaline phosphatase family protein, partial [Desulfurococcales archaeon]|nr:alkaline phosphatase family protein [Desulfurococcales archaeon]
MKVVIVAIDGLEYNLVEKWNIDLFKQKMYGKHDVKVAVRSNEPLYTPLIWASFLLGEPSYKYGYTKIKLEERRGVYGYKSVLKYLYLIKLKTLGPRSLKIRDLMIRLKLYDFDKVRKSARVIEAMPKGLLEKTFIYDALKKGYKVVYNSIPSLPNDRYAEYRAYLFKYFNSSIDERVNILNMLYNETEKDLQNIINELYETDLAIYYTPLIDEAHHMLYRPRSRKAMIHLRRYYKLVEKQVYKLMKLLEDQEKLFLIVSDHGYDPSIHEHSDYGFWSSNIYLNVKP